MYIYIKWKIGLRKSSIFCKKRKKEKRNLFIFTKEQSFESDPFDEYPVETRRCFSSRKHDQNEGKINALGGRGKKSALHIATRQRFPSVVEGARLFLPSDFSLWGRWLVSVIRAAWKAWLSISVRAPNSDPSTRVVDPFEKWNGTRLSPECRRSRDSWLKGKAAGKPLCSLNRGRLRGWKYIMGNITDECWPVRETATSGDNLVTWTTSGPSVRFSFRRRRNKNGELEFGFFPSFFFLFGERRIVLLFFRVSFRMKIFAHFCFQGFGISIWNFSRDENCTGINIYIFWASF